MNTHRRLIQSVIVLGLLAAVVSSAGPSRADVMAPTELPLASYGDILVDAVNSRMFISGGPSDDRVLVLDLDGTVTKTITGLPGAFGMAFSPEGSILWVAAENADAVVGLSTTTFQEVDRVNLPGKCPRYVAVTGTKMAVGPTCYIMVTLDLAGDRTPVPVYGDILVTPLLESTGLASGLVLGATTEMTSTDVYLLDISGPTETVVAQRTGLNGTARDLSVSPDGSTALLATGSRLYALDATDLSDAASPTVAGLTNAVSWSPDGTKFVTTGGLQPTLELFNWGEPAAEWTFDTTESPQLRGVAISPDNTSVYLVTNPLGSPGLMVLTVGVNPGSIGGTIRGYGDWRLDQPHVDLIDSEGNYLFTTNAKTTGSDAGTYTIENLEPDTYYAVFWNGDDQFIYDFFPEWYQATPLLRSSQATPIVVGNGEDITGVDAQLRWFYADMFGSTFEDDIYWLGNTGITKGCNPPSNTLYCPDATVTRGQMAAFLVRALGLTDSGTTDFVDDDGSIFEDAIEKLATAGITKGCNPPTNDHFCPDDFVTRGQMAAFLKRALSG